MIPEPVRSRWPAIVGVLVAMVLIGFIAWGLWQASRPVTPPLQGQMEARTIDVAAKVTGRIVKKLVSEGADVKAGQILVELALPELDAKLAGIEAQRTAAQARQTLVDEGARPQEIAAAKAEWARAEAGAVLAGKTHARLQALYSEGLVAAQRYDEAKAQWTSAVELSRAAEAKYQIVKLGARTAEKTAAAALTTQAGDGVKEVSLLAAERNVVSPIAAQVERVVFGLGELAPAGYPLVTLVDLSDQYAKFNLREEDLPGVTIGSVFEARVPALGERKLRLRVYYISPRGDYATWRSTRQSSGYDMRSFEVRARPETPDPQLRPGMSVLVDR